MMGARDQYVIFDYAREYLNFVNYGVLEEIKDGYFQNTKYQCRDMFYLHTMKVAIFMNEYPNMTALSEDRYDIMTLHDDIDNVQLTAEEKAINDLLDTIG